ncbi:MAG: class I SAM-dependent methyltransferase [Sedimentisphaerales bacterium]|nr:class I SAM-dependent methyltransferase [Sedimentisphaerales bacterium]
MKAESKVLEDFYLLSEYLGNEGRIEDVNEYKSDFSAFLSHASHIKAYDFVAPFCEDKKVLDVGCFIGYGETRIYSKAKEIVAIDSDDNAIEFARQNRFIPNVKFEKVDAKHLPFSDESFNIVIAFQLIEHISPEETGRFLSEVWRVLKMNGLLFVVTPNRKFRLLPFQRPFNSEHFREFTAKGLYKILQANFKDVKVKGIRAKEWIEEIERKRIRKSPYNVYIHHPLSRLMKKKLPNSIKIFIKEYVSKKTKLSQLDNTMKKNNDEFNNLFQKFIMDDYFLESRELNKSIDLYGICKKI